MCAHSPKAGVCQSVFAERTARANVKLSHPPHSLTFNPLVLSQFILHPVLGVIGFGQGWSSGAELHPQGRIPLSSTPKPGIDIDQLPDVRGTIARRPDLHPTPHGLANEIMASEMWVNHVVNEPCRFSAGVVNFSSWVRHHTTYSTGENSS